MRFHFSWFRCLLVVIWFVALVIWNVPSAWSVVTDAEKPRVFLAALAGLATPSEILLSLAAIVLISVVNIDPSLK